MSLTQADLIDRIEEAYSVLKRLPDPDRKYRIARLTKWPVYLQNFMEAYGRTPASFRQPVPSPGEIDRAEEVVEWFAAYLGDHPKGAKACWLCYGRGFSLRQAGAMIGLGKTQVERVRGTALKLLLHNLNLTKGPKGTIWAANHPMLEN